MRCQILLAGRRLLTMFVATVLTAGLTLAAGSIETPACSDADFHGTYAFQSTGINVMNNLPVNFVGSIHADGKGAITAWVDSMATPESVPAPPVLKSVRPFTDIYEWAGRDIQYEVEPDCRITISATIQTPDGRRIPMIHVGALAAGGREALLMNGSAGAPFLITTTMKRSEDVSREELMKLMRKIAKEFYIHE